VALFVRSWNVFHGNANPPRRRSYLREMMALAVAGEPDVVALQEVPVWALGQLASWSGMQVFPAVARSGLRPAILAGWITRLDNGFFRSAFAGQANVLLLRRDHPVEDLGAVQVNVGKERRVCQAVRVDQAVVVGNTHLNSGDDQQLELERARQFVESCARPGEPVVLAGDLNVREPRLNGYSTAGPAIDHVLVRGAPAGDPVVWPEQRRLQNGLVLSDHAPVEVLVG
jgi:endonuclease/exonuclease/phosphatase family metal-dependent hydrolase